MLLGATLVWFFLALPFGLVAVGCALVDRRRTRARTGRPAGGIVTAGLVLGLAAVPLSLGGLVVLPRAHDFVGDSVTDANGVVSGDLDQVERSFHQQVDDLDRTLTRNVDASTRSLSSDFDQLETDSQREIAASEARLNALLAQLQKDAKSDTSTLEKSLRADLATEQLVIQRIETDLRNDLANTKAEVAELRARLDAAG